MAIFFPYSPDIYYGWDEVLWIVANIGMVGAVVGILALDAGNPGWVTRLSGIMVITGE